MPSHVFQFQLRHLFLLILLSGMLVAGYSAHTPFLTQKEMEASSFLEKRGFGVNHRNGHVVCITGYAYDLPPLSSADIEGLKCLRWCTHLRYVQFDGLPLPDEVVYSLQDCADLKVLGLSRTRISDAALEGIGHFTQLTNLYLNENDISDAGIRQLRHLRQLRRVNLSDTRITDASVLVLEKMGTLDALRVRDTGISEAGYSQLRAALPKCWVE